MARSGDASGEEKYARLRVKPRRPVWLAQLRPLGDQQEVVVDQILETKVPAAAERGDRRPPGKFDDGSNTAASANLAPQGRAHEEGSAQ